MKKIDLHIHTVKSDGDLTPKEIIDVAAENGISTISITDHDTIEAYNEELLLYARKKEINVIPGVEISANKNKNSIHILGYNIDLKNEKLKETLKNIRNFRHDYLYNVNEKLKELGYVLNVEKLDKIEAVTKAHIALEIINNIKNKEKLLSEFGNIPSKGQFIETIMNENCPAYIKKETVTPQTAAKIIKEAKGKVVLAHPVAYIYEDGLKEKDIYNIVQEIKPDGIEANYIYINNDNEVINEINIWNNFAKRNNLFVTIGSDFHNKDNIRPEIGFNNMTYPINEDEVKNIIKNLSLK